MQNLGCNRIFYHSRRKVKMDYSEIIKSRASGLGEKVFIAPNIPENKLRNTVSGITGNACNAKSIIAVVDTTVFGACDDGLAFTENALYYKALFQKTICIPYADIASVSANGIVLKDLVIKGHNGSIIQKIESQDFKTSVAADILNNIVEAREEEKRRALQKAGGQTPEKKQYAPDDFQKARKSLLLHAAILLILGFFFMGLWWWGIPAFIIGIMLIVKYNKDAALLDEGMPVQVYCEDTKEFILQAYIGTIMVIGVLVIPGMESIGQKRLSAIRNVMNKIQVIRKEKLINLFLQAYDSKSDKRARTFVNGYLDWMEEQKQIFLIQLGNTDFVFTPAFLEKVMVQLDSAAKSEIRISREKLISEIKKIFNEEDEVIETLINFPDTGIESYTFQDGTYYVHGINDDYVRVCSSCCIAEIVDPDDTMNDGTYFCSDYCKETDKQCEKLIQDLRKKRFEEADIEAASFGGALPHVLSSISYNKGNVAARSNTGHGVAAENANTRIDKLLGKQAKVVGSDNAKDGADRLVNGIEIQSKYCSTAKQSINSAFAQDGQGQYRYVDTNGKTMQLEVPRNQYEDAVAEMRRKFHEGKLPPDIKTEADAEKIVRKGHLTYKQAQNICKFGTIESIAYDAYTGVIVGSAAGGLSFVLTTALTYYKTGDLKKSLQASISTSLQTGGKAFAVYVLTAQLQRTEFVKAFIHKSAMDINFGAHGKFVERIGHRLDKMSGAKSGSFTKNANVAVKGAVITAAATFAVTSAWEVGKFCSGKMSGMQCFKNIIVSGGGIATGTVGALIGGALLAPIPGGVFLGGLIGGAIGGMLGSSAAKAGMDKVIEDDSVVIMAIVSDEFKLIAASLCLNPDEIQKATIELDKLISNSKNFVEDVYSKKQYRRHYVARLLRPIFIQVCMLRPVLCNQDISSDAIEAAIIDVA